MRVMIDFNRRESAPIACGQRACLAVEPDLGAARHGTSAPREAVACQPLRGSPRSACLTGASLSAPNLDLCEARIR
jgi:hypothetical protein